MQASINMNGGQAVVKLAGRFDFNTHRSFRAAYEPLLADATVSALQVDLEGVDYLDSSALGMLLMLRDKAEAVSKPVSLANLRGGVKQVLEIANFGKLFQIE